MYSGLLLHVVSAYNTPHFGGGRAKLKLMFVNVKLNGWPVRFVGIILIAIAKEGKYLGNCNS